MFGSEVASAYVRIRPNLSGFKSETETGVRSAFSELAKVAGVALGAGAAFEFGKSAVEDAANLQKQAETIRSEFGSAGKALLQFADNGGVALGSINANTDATSAKLGTLFRNMGIGKKVAADMTMNWEKLALAFNATSGGGTGGAATILQQLQTAAVTGSARGLRNLGIQFNTTQLQAAAFKLGITQTTSQALLPAQKAIAVYALAMQHLPGLLAQAKAHAGDFANVQARLSAEWQRAKEMLGQALLPEFTKLAKVVGDWLEKMVKSGRLQRDFNEVGRVAAEVIQGIVGIVQTGVRIWEAFSGAVGGTKNAVEILLGAMAVSKFASIAGGVVRLASTFAGPLMKAIRGAQLLWMAATLAMEGETLGLAIVVRTALITTGIGALVVAVGVATAFIVTHWEMVKGVTVALASGIAATWGGLKTLLIGLGETIAGSMATSLLYPLRIFVYGIQGLSDLLDVVGIHFLDFSNNIGKSLDSVSTSLAATGFKKIAAGGKEMADAFRTTFTKAAQKWGTDQAQQKNLAQAGQAATQSFADGMQNALGPAFKSLGTALATTLSDTVAAAHKAIASSIRSAKDNLAKIGQDLAKTIEQIQAKIGGAAGAVAGSPQGQAFAKLKKLIESGAPSFEIARAREELASQLQNVGKKQQPKVATDLANLTASFDKNQIGYRQFEERLHKILRDDGITMQQALKAGGPAFADAFKAQVSALGQQAKEIAALPAKFRGVGGAGGSADIKIIRPLQVIREENAKIAAAAARQRAAQLKAQEKANVTLQAIHSTQLSSSPPPGFGKQRKGKGSHDARTGAKIGHRG